MEENKESLNKENEQNPLRSIRSFGDDQKNMHHGDAGFVAKEEAKEIQRKQEEAKKILIEEKKLKEEELELLKKNKELQEKNEQVNKETGKNQPKDQNTIVKTAKLEQAWKDFSTRRGQWLEKGIKARDIRDFQKEYSKKNILKNILLYSLIIFFLVGGLFISSGYLFYTKIAVKTTKVEEKIKSRFGAEKTISINASIDIDPVRKVISEDQKLDLLTEIIPYKIINEQPERISAKELFSSFKTNIPTLLLSSLSGQSFLGTFPIKNKNGFILVLYLKDNNFAGAQSGVFAWEKILIHDIQKIFPDLYPGDLAEFESIGFYTNIIDNQTTRILEDTSGEIRLLYSIVNTRALIIATNKEVFIEILNRARATIK